ncbi:MAG: hypothetical protein JNM43_13760 [Planctomycetaceae bacterium]|nr:hypothetical protein [Planctomycetaceae bacterium]
MFQPQIEIVSGDRCDSVVVILRQSCKASDWPVVLAAIQQEFRIGNDVTIDLRCSPALDPSIEQKLMALTAELEGQGKRLSVLLPGRTVSPVSRAAASQ